MLRAIFSILSIFSVVTLLGQALIVGWLWVQGSLNPTALREVRLALSGQTASETVATTDATAQVVHVSQDEVQEARLIRVLELQSRENELSLLKRLTSETAIELISDRRALDQLKAEFRDELERLRQQAEDGATEQTRGILLTSPPEEAVKRLLGLTVPEGVSLLRGLPEKSISRILQAFQADPQSSLHGQQLFEGIYRGEPARSVIEDTLDQLDPNATPPGPTG